MTNENVRGSLAETADKPDMKVKLSTLWIFAVFNYLYADIVGLMDPVLARKMISGTAVAFSITEGFLLGGAVLMETAIAMILLSRIIKYRLNRIANIIAGILHTLAVTASLFAGEPTMYYLFFAAIEIPCTLYIVGCAWRWKNIDGRAAA